MLTSKIQYEIIFLKIYKGMKMIIIKNLYLILKIINGNIVIKNISFVYVNGHKKWLQCILINVLINFNKFILKIVSLQNITLKGFSKNVIPILPISRSFNIIITY